MIPATRWKHNTPKLTPLDGENKSVYKSFILRVLWDIVNASEAPQIKRECHNHFASSLVSFLFTSFPLRLSSIGVVYPLFNSSAESPERVFVCIASRSIDEGRKRDKMKYEKGKEQRSSVLWLMYAFKLSDGLNFTTHMI